jgi:hypothetical protein
MRGSCKCLPEEDEEVALPFGSATHWRNGIAGLSNRRQEEVASGRALADMADLLSVAVRNGAV